MPLPHSRMKHEAATVEAMIRLYCRTENHQRLGVLCTECAEMIAYAKFRLEKCPYQEGKTTCALCPTHCYKPEMRVRIRQIMRVCGPRMLVHHPLMTFRHVLDGWRKTPIKTLKRKLD